MTSKKKSLTERLNTAAGKTPPTTTPQPVPVAEQKPETKSTRPPSREGKKTICVHVDPAVNKSLKGIALDEDATVQSLMVEAINMLLSSRGKPPIA